MFDVLLIIAKPSLLIVYLNHCGVLDLIHRKSIVNAVDPPVILENSRGTR